MLDSYKLVLGNSRDIQITGQATCCASRKSSLGRATKNVSSVACQHFNLKIPLSRDEENEVLVID